MTSTLRFLGWFTGIISFVSLIQHIFNIGLGGIYLDFIEYYRNMSSWVFNYFKLEAPQALIDLWSISFIGAGAYIRTPNIEQSRVLSAFNLTKFHNHWKTLVFFILGSTFMGCAILLSTLSPTTYIDEMNPAPLDLIKGTAKNALIIVTGMVLFFALNAYVPSI